MSLLNKKDWALLWVEINLQITLISFLRYINILALEQYLFIYIVLIRKASKQQFFLFH